LVRYGVRVASGGLAGRNGSGRIGCGHAGMWPTVRRPNSVQAVVLLGARSNARMGNDGAV
jgi:hypothetical protein